MLGGFCLVDFWATFFLAKQSHRTKALYVSFGLGVDVFGSLFCLQSNLQTFVGVMRFWGILFWPIAHSHFTKWFYETKEQVSKPITQLGLLILIRCSEEGIRSG